MHSLSTAALVCVLLGLASCRTVKVDQKAYSGKWHSVYTNQWVNWFFAKGSYCLQAEYTSYDSGYLFSHSANKGSPNGTKSTATGTLTVQGSFPSGNFLISYDGFPITLGIPYWVIKVGPIVNGAYEYAVVSNYLKSLVVLSRDPASFQAKYDDELKKFLSSNGFGFFPYKPVPVYQGSDCNY